MASTSLAHGHYSIRDKQRPASEGYESDDDDGEYAQRHNSDMSSLIDEDGDEIVVMSDEAAR
jgi:hypothetical protein